MLTKYGICSGDVDEIHTRLGIRDCACFWKVSILIPFSMLKVYVGMHIPPGASTQRAASSQACAHAVPCSAGFGWAAVSSIMSIHDHAAGRIRSSGVACTYCRPHDALRSHDDADGPRGWCGAVHRRRFVGIATRPDHRLVQGDSSHRSASLDRICAVAGTPCWRPCPSIRRRWQPMATM